MTIQSIEDLRRLSMRRVPRVFFDYVDGGSWSEGTSRANIRDLTTLPLRQRIGVDVSQRTLRSTMAGQAVRMPVALAPAGLTGMQRADGEILAARAAEKFGVPFVLSTMSTCSMEDVAGQTSSPFWFQLYVFRDRQFVLQLLERAQAVRCPVLVVTMDLPIMAPRLRDVRNRLAVPFRLDLATLLGFASRPGWSLGMLKTPRRGFGNIIGHAPDVNDLSSLAAWSNQQIDPRLTWDDVKWVRRHWKGKLLVKGVMDREDAVLAMQCGADGIIVSNHGGRQLDGTISSARALHGIAETIGGKIEVHADGGIRCGQDVLRMHALGADAVYIGRPYLYGLGALGEAGVARCLEILEQDLSQAMALCGVKDINRVDHTILLNRF